MSMLNNLKKTQKNHVFLDDEDDMDIDNMDFPLPNEPSSSSSSARRAPAGGVPGMGGMGGMPDLSSMMSAMGGMGGMGGGMGGGGGMPDMAQLQQMMQSMGGAGGLGGDTQRPGAAMAAPPARESVVTVASGPNGVARQMRPEEYKE